MSGRLLIRFPSNGQSFQLLVDVDVKYDLHWRCDIFNNTDSGSSRFLYEYESYNFPVYAYSS